jgi:hypothetical protein
MGDLGKCGRTPLTIIIVIIITENAAACSNANSWYDGLVIADEHSTDVLPYP